MWRRELLERLLAASHVVEILDHGSHELSVAATAGGPACTLPVPYLVLERADACLATLLLYRARLPVGSPAQALSRHGPGHRPSNTHETTWSIEQRQVADGLVFSDPEAGEGSRSRPEQDTREAPRGRVAMPMRPGVAICDSLHQSSYGCAVRRIWRHGRGRDLSCSVRFSSSSLPAWASHRWRWEIHSP